MDGTTNIIELKGIGEKSATAFGRLGIRDVDSLITMYPKYYLTYEDPKDVNEIEIGQREMCIRDRQRYLRQLHLPSVPVLLQNS